MKNSTTLEVWYFKSKFFAHPSTLENNELARNDDYSKKVAIELDKTHAKVFIFENETPEQIFLLMNNEPFQEFDSRKKFKEFVEENPQKYPKYQITKSVRDAKNVRHQSMSVGDILVDRENGIAYLTESVGFKEIPLEEIEN